MVKGHVKFDEATIAEHDKDRSAYSSSANKLRGTRMKIDEPDTPFARSPARTDSEDDGHSPKLCFFPEGASDKTDEDDRQGDSESSRRAFREQRKAHYNEMQMARALNSKRLSEEALIDADTRK